MARHPITEEQFNRIVSLVSEIQKVCPAANTSSINMWLTAVVPEETTPTPNIGRCCADVAKVMERQPWIVFLTGTRWLGGINGHSVPRESAQGFDSEEDANAALKLRREKKRAFDGGEYPDAFVEQSWAAEPQKQ